jgi:hypothetical protein
MSVQNSEKFYDFEQLYNYPTWTAFDLVNTMVTLQLPERLHQWLVKKDMVRKRYTETNKRQFSKIPFHAHNYSHDS